jgi:ABC-type uncharacterized transport system substrate-binding protein
VQAAVSVFKQSLQQLGWTEGRNLRFDIRWGAGDASQTRRHAADLVALAPDVIVVIGTAAMGPLILATRTIPIVFNNVSDPVGAGYVESMAHPVEDQRDNGYENALIDSLHREVSRRQEREAYPIHCDIDGKVNQ